MQAYYDFFGGAIVTEPLDIHQGRKHVWRKRTNVAVRRHDDSMIPRRDHARAAMSQVNS
jgi:hypothetical protein